MKTTSRSLRWGLTTLVSVLVVAGPAFAAKQNPTSKLYIADLSGQSEIDTGERIEDLRAKSVHNAQGTVIETMEDANNSMVFSNGTGLYLDPETRVEVRRFVQEPFTPNRTDLETEPSISQTYGYMPRGRIGICAPRMVAGSSMVYATPHASVSIRGKRVVVQADDFETKVSSVEGDVTITGKGTGSNGRTLSGGQQAIIRHLPGQPATIEIGPIPDAEVQEIEDRVTMACNARRTVYFDVAKKKSEINSAADDPTATVDDEKGPDEEGDGETKEESAPGENPSFGEIFLDDPAGEGESDLEFVVVPVSPVEPPQEVIGSPDRIVTN